MSEVKLKPCPFCGSRVAPTIMDQNEAMWNDPGTHESPSEIAANGSKTNEERTFDKLQAEIRKRLTDDLKRF